MGGLWNWLMLIPCLIIIIFIIIAFIYLCIHFPGLSEWTCGNKCLKWNTEIGDKDVEAGRGNKCNNMRDVEMGYDGDTEKDSAFEESDVDTSETTCDIEYRNERTDRSCNNKGETLPSRRLTLPKITVEATGDNNYQQNSDGARQTITGIHKEHPEKEE